MKDNELHPVRFTVRQVEFIRHMISEIGYDYFEEECADLVETMDKDEKEFERLHS